MMRVKSNGLPVATLTVLLAAALVFGGCSESPLNSSTPEEPVLLTKAACADGVAKVVNLYVEDQISSEKGGVLTLADVTLEIPPGAVPNDTTYSIFIPDDEVFYNEFGTDGLVFDVPVTVTMSYRDADLSAVDESTIRIGYFNEATGQFEDLECRVDFVNKTVTATLSHFSAYGLISDRLGTGGGY